MFYTSSIFCLILLSVAALCIYLLLHQLQRQNLRIKTLIKSNEKLSLSDERPPSLGRLFAQDSKSLSISIGNKGQIIAANDNLLGLLGFTKKQLI